MMERQGNSTMGSNSPPVSNERHTKRKKRREHSDRKHAQRRRLRSVALSIPASSCHGTQRTRELKQTESTGKTCKPTHVLQQRSPGRREEVADSHEVVSIHQRAQPPQRRRAAFTCGGTTTETKVHGDSMRRNSTATHDLECRHFSQRPGVFTTNGRA